MTQSTATSTTKSSSPTSLKLGLIQHACSDDVQKNYTKAEGMIRDAASQGAELIITQELFTGLYFCVTEDEKHFQLAEPIPGPTTQKLCDLAKELGVSISASMFEKRAPGLCHNTSVLINPKGEITGKYRKMHIPDDPGYYEKYYFTPGDLGFLAHPIETNENNGQTKQPSKQLGKVGMLVCWDQWFPEGARLTAMQGAELLLYPTAIGAYHDEDPREAVAQREAWMMIQRSHAIANGLFVASVNRVGEENGTHFWGSSFVADPMGRLLVEGSKDQEEILLCDIDFKLVEQYRLKWCMFFRDRRNDAYAGITNKWGQA